MSHTLILLRHGQSEFNDQNLFAGWIDVSLTSNGINQATKAADLLISNRIHPDIIYTSKLKRTCQTGNIILSRMNREWCEVKRSWRLNERHYGKLQGLRKNDVLAKVGKEQYMYWRRDYQGCPPLLDDDQNSRLIDDRYKFDDIKEFPKGESLKMVVERLKGFLYGDIQTELIKNNKTVLVVGHGSTIRAILKLIKNISDEDIKNVNIPNSIPLVLEVNDDFQLIKDETYLDPKEAELRSELVRKEGFSKL